MASCATCSTGRGPVVGRRVELTAMRADGTEFPVELVVTRPDDSRRAGLLRLPARPHRALRRRGVAAPAGRRAGGAAAGRDRGGGRARSVAAVRARVSEEVGRLLEAQHRAHVPLRRRRARRHDHRRLGAAARARAAGRARGCRWTATRRSRACGGPARAARMDNYDGRRGRAGGADARVRRAGRGRRAGLPRRRRCGARSSSPRWSREPFPADAEQRIAYFAELAAQALANAQAREELAASRARIVAAGDAERRRLERNLHDGAQQRLVSLALMLRLAARRHPRRRAISRAPARSSRTRCRSCASSPAASTRRS